MPSGCIRSMFSQTLSSLQSACANRGSSLSAFKMILLAWGYLRALVGKYGCLQHSVALLGLAVMPPLLDLPDPGCHSLHRVPAAAAPAYRGHAPSSETPPLLSPLQNAIYSRRAPSS